jgi:hypothetical protein
MPTQSQQIFRSTLAEQSEGGEGESRLFWLQGFLTDKQEQKEDMT